MNLTTLKTQIKADNLDSFYIFTGPEWTLINSYITAMAKFTDSDIIRLDDAKDLIKKLGTKSMLKSRHIYVLRDCKDFLSSEELQAKFERFRASETIIILVYTAIDKRSKLYKKFQDKIVQFDYMSEDILVKYIQKEIPLSDRNARGLVQICDRDYGRILLEIDKINNYRGAVVDSRPIIEVIGDSIEVISSNEIFKTLLDSGIIYQSPQDRLFDFVDAVLRYKPKKAFEIYEECIESGESVLVLLTNLYNNVKQVLQYQTCSGNDVERVTGMTSAQVYYAKNKSGIYTDDELMYFLTMIQKCDVAIKQGIIEESAVIPYLLVRFWD